MRSDAVEPFITTRCILLEHTLIGVGGFDLLFLLPHQVSSDGLVRYDTLRALMDKGTISPEKYSFLQTVLSVPLYLAGEFVAGKPQTAVAYFNVLVFLAAKGLLIFIPGLLLCVTPALQRLDHTLRSFQAAALLFTAGLVLVYAKYWAWYAGWYWGPRYFLFACIPGTMALAWHLTYPSPRSGIRALSLAATMWSGWVGICGAIFGQEGMEICINNDFALEALCWYTPEYSALIHPFIQPRSFSRRELVTATWIVAATATLVVPHLRPLFANIVRRVRVLRLSDLL